MGSFPGLAPLFCSLASCSSVGLLLFTRVPRGPDPCSCSSRSDLIAIGSGPQNPAQIVVEPCEVCSGPVLGMERLSASKSSLLLHRGSIANIAITRIIIVTYTNLVT